MTLRQGYSPGGTVPTYRNGHDQLRFRDLIAEKLSQPPRKKRNLTRFQAFARVVLHLVGLACLTIAGFEWHSIAGFVAAGLSAFVLSALTITDNEQTEWSEPHEH